jgi:chorismate dehydratase
MKIKVGIVNYLNTKPMLYGIERSPVLDEIELIKDYPSNIASALLKNEIDVGLVPVAIIPKLKYYELITDYCIGCDGAVASVCLFSDVPLEEVETVLLDYQSRTSVELARLLLRDYWKINPELLPASVDFRQCIKGTTAGVVIGDRALQQRKQSRFVYDLGEAWKNHTGLPFVFAAWISNKQLDKEFIQSFNDANKAGVQNIAEVIQETESDVYDMREYFTNNVSYELNDRKREALQLFLKNIGLVSV